MKSILPLILFYQVFITMLTFTYPLNAHADQHQFEQSGRATIDDGRVLFFEMTKKPSLFIKCKHYFETLKKDHHAHQGLVSSYLGMIHALEARDHFWPWKKLELAKKALKILDTQVQKYPDSFEIRLLRLKLWQNLPSFFGKEEEIEEEKDHLLSWFKKGDQDKLAPLVYQIALEILEIKERD